MAYTITIMLHFLAKGLSLYFARTNINIVGYKIAGELQKKIAKSILFFDVQTLDNRHSGRYVSNISYDAGQVSHFVSTGIFKLDERYFFGSFFSWVNVLSKLEVSIFCNFYDTTLQVLL